MEITHGIETTDCGSAGEFVAKIRLSNDYWWDDDNTCPWVFRGHAFENWRLSPTAWRSDNEVMTSTRTEAARRFDRVQPTQGFQWFLQPNFVTGHANFGSNQLPLGRRLTIETTAEYIPIWGFSATCDELGIPVPLVHPGPEESIDPDWLPNRGMTPLIDDELLRFSDLPAMLALAQHHGVPTRLLDWTKNSMAAAFFAVEPLEKPAIGQNLVLWALHQRNAERVTVRGTAFPEGPGASNHVVDAAIAIVRPSTRDNSFMAAQSGLFSAIRGSGIHFMINEGFRPSLEEFVKAATPDYPVLRKIRLPHQHAAELIQILRREKVSRSSLMPTIDNAARDVLTRWRQKEHLSE